MWNISRTQSRWLAGSILCLFFLIGLILLRSHSPIKLQNPTGPTADSAQPSPSLESKSGFTLNSFHRSQTKDGKIIWEVIASKGEYYPETNKVRIFDGKLLLFKKEGQAIQLETKESLLTLEGQALIRAENSGGVKVVQNDLTLVTEQAVYDRAADSITAPGHVTITSDLFILEGDGLSGTVEQQNFHLLKNVKTLLKPKQPRKKNGNN